MRFSLSLTLFILYSASFALRFQLPFPFAWFVIGGIIGFFFVFIDKFVQILIEKQFRKKDGPNVDEVRQYVDQAVHDNHIQPILHSIYFLLAYILLALFVITSSGSVLGVGLILGIGCYYVSDLLTHWNDHPYIIKTYLKQVNHHFTSQQIRYLIVGAVGTLVFFTIMVWK